MNQHNANADQSFHWTDGTKQVLKQKSLGQAIMLSDFVEEVGGMLECDGEKATFHSGAPDRGLLHE